MSDYIPLSLKYRPRTPDEIVGQDVLKRILVNSIKMGRVHHGYMLFGPWGVGKTSAARVLAACLNSPGGETSNPKSCKEVDAILDGTSPDVVEIDGASDGQVDNIRDLKVEAGYRPVSSKYKIFIIDEIHAMSRGSFEAMLKLLEEPPDYVKFILCTTERAKIKPTIQSRCQTFVLKLMPWGLIAAYIKEICKKENIQIDDDGAKAIAKMADGHMRDAMQHLETSICYASGEPLTGDLVRTAIGSVDEQLYFDFAEAVITMKYGAGVKAIQRLLLSGNSVGTLVNGLLEHLRVLMLISIGESTAGIISLTPEEGKKYLQQRNLMKIDLIDDMITNLVGVHRGLFYNTSPQILFEQLLLKSIKTNHRLKSSS